MLALLVADKAGYLIKPTEEHYEISSKHSKDEVVLHIYNEHPGSNMNHALDNLTNTRICIHYKNLSKPSLQKIHPYIENCVLSKVKVCDEYDILFYTSKPHTVLAHPEKAYLNLLQNVMVMGEDRPDRTGTGTISVFGSQVRFDISTHIPILTTKLVPWRLVVEELLWFMRGDTDSTILEAKGVNIWKGNSSREFLDSRGLTNLPVGDIGAGYGFQWRHFGESYVNCNSKYEGGVDQLENVMHLLRTDPFSRRIMMTAWNPKDLDKMALPPCHNQVQFYVSVDPKTSEKQLSCHMYQRSVDLFLGFPWNILSYSILTHILALKTDLKPKELVISTGDTHIYKDHLEQVQEQLRMERTLLPLPLMHLNPSIRDKKIEDITLDDFVVHGYFHHSHIKAKMSV